MQRDIYVGIKTAIDTEAHIMDNVAHIINLHHPRQNFYRHRPTAANLAFVAEGTAESAGRPRSPLSRTRLSLRTMDCAYDEHGRR